VGQANLLDGEVLDAQNVRTSIGDLACGAHSFPCGMAVTVLIRPEAIRPAQSAMGPNRFAGCVTRDRFLGALRRFDFTLPGGQYLTIETDSHVAPPSAIELPPVAVQVIAAGQAGAERSAETKNDNPAVPA
jgi:putative spermidine/putrescine transport system ATP-binding protein